MNPRLQTVSGSEGTLSCEPGVTFTNADLRAFAWLRDGMLRYLELAEPKGLEKLQEKVQAAFDEVENAFKRMDPDLIRYVSAFIDILKPFRGQPVYVLMGFHGALLFADDESGYFEFDSPEMARDKIIEILDLAHDTGVGLNLEFEVSSLQVLSERFPELHPKLLQSLREGTAEIVNSTYSHPYTLLIGPESNIRQFEYGGAVMHQLYGLRPKVYACSEFAYHPQIPQILRHFGIEYSGLRSRLAGMGPSAPFPVILWEGLDGSTVRALCHQTNFFAGEYYASIFYKEIFSHLIQARSGTNRGYVVMTALVDHTVEMEDDVDQALRVSRFCDLVGIHKTYSQFFEEGPQPAAIYNFPFDQYDHAFLIPHEVNVHGPASRKIKLAIAALERRLLQIEALVGSLMLSGHSMENSAHELHELWKPLLLNQNHDTLGVPEYRKGQYHRERMFLNEAVFKPYVEAVHDDGISIGEKSLRLLEEALHQAESVAQRALKQAGVITAPASGTMLYLNPRGRAIDSVPPGASILSADRQAKPTPSQQVRLQSGRLQIVRPNHAPLTLEFVGPDGATQFPLAQIGEQQFESANGIRVTVSQEDRNLMFDLNVPQHSQRLCFRGFRSGTEFWRNYPMGAEATRCARFATSDYVWLPGEFMIFSQTNHYYQTDLEHTHLIDYLHDPGQYRLVLIMDVELDLPLVNMLAAELRLPPAMWSITPREDSVTLAGSVRVDHARVAIQALIPGEDELRLRLINYALDPVTTRVHLPDGWFLGEKIDGYGNPVDDAPPRGQSEVQLAPWSYGTYRLRRG